MVFAPVHVDDDAKEAGDFRHVKAVLRAGNCTIAEQNNTWRASRCLGHYCVLASVPHCQNQYQFNSCSGMVNEG